MRRPGAGARPECGADLSRWGLCFAAVLAAHAGLVTALGLRREPLLPSAPPATAIVIDLTPLPPAPAEPVSAASEPAPADPAPAEPQAMDRGAEPPLDSPTAPAAETPPERDTPPEPRIPAAREWAEPALQDPPPAQPAGDLPSASAPVAPAAPPSPIAAPAKPRPPARPLSRPADTRWQVKPTLESAPKPKPTRADKAARLPMETAPAAGARPAPKPTPGRDAPSAPAPKPAAARSQAASGIQAAGRGTRPGSEAQAPQRASTDELQAWRSRLVAHLTRYHQSNMATAQQQQGAATIVLKLDGRGRVLSSAVVGSSGSPVLDQASLAVIRRAQPLPAPPPGAGNQEFTMRLRFDAR